MQSLHILSARSCKVLQLPDVKESFSWEYSSLLKNSEEKKQLISMKTAFNKKEKVDLKRIKKCNSAIIVAFLLLNL